MVGPPWRGDWVHIYVWVPGAFRRQWLVESRCSKGEGRHLEAHLMVCPLASDKNGIKIIVAGEAIMDGRISRGRAIRKIAIEGGKARKPWRHGNLPDDFRNSPGFGSFP